MKATIILVLVSFIACTLLFAEEVLTISGVEKLKIDEISPDTSGSLYIFAGEVRKECANVVSIQFEGQPKKAKNPVTVHLSNGDWIDGKVVGGQVGSLTMESESLGNVQIKFEKMRALFISDNISEKGFVASKLELNNSSDMVFLKEGSATEGLVERISQDGVAIKVKALGTTITFPFEKISGVLLVLTEVFKKPESLQARVFTLDGSCVSGKLTAPKGDTVNVESPVCGQLSIKKSDVDSIYFAGGNFTYLSDMIPADIVETPFFDNFLYPYQRDRSLEKKEPICVRGRIYRKGVSAHSKTELTYDLDGKYRVFLSKLAIDDEAKEKGNVTILIYGDEKELHKSEDITGKSEAVSVQIDVKGIKKLKLVVDFGKGLDTMDRAVFADAVLVK